MLPPPRARAKDSETHAPAVKMAQAILTGAANARSIPANDVSPALTPLTNGFRRHPDFSAMSRVAASLAS